MRLSGQFVIGLLRRFAPRNDGGKVALVMTDGVVSAFNDGNASVGIDLSLFPE